MRIAPGGFTGLRLAPARVNLNISGLIPHKARRAESIERAGNAVNLMRIHHVTSNERNARAASVDVIDLRERHPSIKGVTVERLTDLKPHEVHGSVEQRVLNGKLRNVRDRNLVAPL